MERGIPVRAVSRSIAALQVVNRRGSVSLMEIARAIGLAYPTAYRIVQTLVYEGLVECEPSRKRYRATALVHSLSSGYTDHGNLVTVARPHIVALTRKISWPIGISTHVGRWMMVRDSTHTLTSLTFTNYLPGYTFPILDCSSGHAYLAFASDEEREGILKGIETLEGPSPQLSIFQSGKVIKRIREDGYAGIERNRHTADPGKTSSISVPIFENGNVAGTLTVTHFASAMPIAVFLKRYAADVKEVAARIGAELSRQGSSAMHEEQGNMALGVGGENREEGIVPGVESAAAQSRSRKK